MTEQELIDLRDSLLGFDSLLTGLEDRVVVLEDLAVPKGAYFDQLTASFAASPACCECSSTTACNCVNATQGIYLLGDGDNLTTRELQVEINGVVYNPTEGGQPSAYVSTDVATFTNGNVFMYNSNDEYVEHIYYVYILNASTNDLCVRLTTVQDAYNNDARPLLALELPTVDGSDLVVRARTAFGLENGADFTFTVNPTLEQDAGNSVVSNTVTFCLAAA